MATLTVRNLDDTAKRKLRERAARLGMSMEQKAREILEEKRARTPRERSIFDELTQLGVKPEEALDQKAVTDEMWNESFR
jgi:plasmid stability protein